MPDKEKPVGIISIRYPATETIVRFHRDDNNVLWVVGADICEMIGLTNISYVGKKLGETKKEYIKIISALEHIGGHYTIPLIEYNLDKQDITRIFNYIED